MQRCRQCDSPLAKIDTACINCGELVAPKESKSGFRQHFGKVVTGLFILSAALTVVALFTNYLGLPFMTGLGTTIVLLMVKKSADEMSSSQR